MDVSSIEKQIKDIENEIFNTQKNKATEHHIGKLKAKLAKLRGEVDKRKNTGVKGKGFSIKKSGDATVGLIGFPSVGKSTLLNQITGAKSHIAPYEFTTLEVIPGIMKFKGASIQILDLPGLISGASLGKGRGREILSAIRNVDLIILMIDPTTNERIDLMLQELYKAGIRLNQKKPDVVIKKTGYGGLNISSTIRLKKLNYKLIKSIVSEYLINANIVIREDINQDQLIDIFIHNRVYISGFVLINKKDIISNIKLEEIINNIKKIGFNVISISAKEKIGLDKLKKFIFNELNLIRIYMKPVGKNPDYTAPLILKKGEDVNKACSKLHKDFKIKFKYAQVWGKSVKFPGQKVGLDHILKDKDILTITISL